MDQKMFGMMTNMWEKKFQLTNESRKAEIGIICAKSSRIENCEAK